MKSENFFVFETRYQFLVVLSILKEKYWGCDKSEPVNKLNGSAVTFIDMTPDDCSIDFNMFRPLLDFDVIRLQPKGFYLDAIRSIALTRNFFACGKRAKLFIFRNREPISNRLAKIFSKKGGVYLIEEGLSLYRKRTSRYSLSHIKGMIKSIFVSLVSYSSYNDHFGESKYISRIYLRYPNLYATLNLNNKSECYQLPPLNFSKFESNIITKSIQGDQDTFKISLLKNTFIFLGQPISELGMVSLAAEIKTISDLIREAKNQGFDVVIKPHPKDSLEKYQNLNCAIMPAKFPAELLSLETQHICGFITFFSTSALNLSQNLDKLAFFAYPLLNITVSHPSLPNLVVIDNIKFNFDI